MATLARDRHQGSGSFLLRLYPAAWRARYGEEFAELLESRPATLRDKIDIVLGAVDARINPQVNAHPVHETRLPHDRSIGAVIVIGGALLTVWAALGFWQMPRWNSGELPARSDLLAISYAAGMFGSFVLGGALLGLASRYAWAIGSSGAAGAALTGAGLVFAAFGGGMPALVLLLSGTLLLGLRTRSRLTGTVSAVALVVTTAVVASTFISFAAGGGQEVGSLWVLIAYGPAWMLFGFDLRAPARPVLAAAG